MDLEKVARMQKAAIDSLERRLPRDMEIRCAVRYATRPQLLIWMDHPCSGLPTSVRFEGESIGLRFIYERLPMAPYDGARSKEIASKLSGGFVFGSMNGRYGIQAVRTIAEAGALGLYAIQAEDYLDSPCVPVGLFKDAKERPTLDGVRLVYVPTVVTPEMLQDDYPKRIMDAFREFHKQFEPPALDFFAFTFYENCYSFSGHGLKIGEPHIIVEGKQNLDDLLRFEFEGARVRVIAND